MKTQKEIVIKAKAYAESIGNEDGTSTYDYVMGYNQCQEDMALSQPKELEPQTEITSAELWQNRYESLLKGLNDITNELNVYKLKKEFDLDKLKESYIELCKTYNASSVIKIWNFFLPHLQKPVESDEDKLLNFAKWYSGMEMSAVKRAYKRYLIENNSNN
jgi:hypothetical protein